MELEGIVAKRPDAAYEPAALRRLAKAQASPPRDFAITGWRPAGPNARRPDAILLARASADGTLQPAGAAELGLRSEDRDRLREALAQRHLGTRRGAHRVDAGVWVDVDFHGVDGGPLRDPVMRGLRVELNATT